MHNIKQPTSCKICDGHINFLGICDFNKNCEDKPTGKILPVNGNAFYYYKCLSCGFIFTAGMDHWTIEDFSKNVYNDDYIIVDPEYSGKRSQFSVSWFSPLLGDDKSISILDYGAGNCTFSKEMATLGWAVESWDPMWDTKPTFDTNTKFDVITSFEVLEHTPTPYQTLDEITKFLNPATGQIVFTTLINDIIGNEGSEYWYIAPRNGHVSMHSTKSLEIMFAKIGMTVHSFSPSQHIASWQ